MRERGDRLGRLEQRPARHGLRAQLQERRTAGDECLREIDRPPARARSGFDVDDGVQPRELSLQTSKFYEQVAE
ncbi:MAG: hypothetical protein AUI64_04905 [Acidobacteria bacterium 13_1_40CM_2_64_6]|nr:MAG: hypothetical protein AUH72_14785 [Acidobacteria bacterium 13_1_40CM_4_65_8]OLD18817.1 MAG: hypothetical protein AUJ01_06860 [Acidobacteria bacterium 13_1_40CM_3_65_5]OLD54484.1 MAG: hypothetical protein AUI64_04905 [Acidobacteria bacterium 13_1_40CM_2_64_6]OLE82843.1 MAG: hypothetical protein AUF76_07875 [Acidobacteria bacterium 13_1_20CM_2_65_9]